MSDRPDQPPADLFRTAFEMAGVGMVLMAPDGRWLRWNQAFEQILGRPQTPQGGDESALYTPATQNDAAEQRRQALLNPTSPLKVERVFLRPGGDEGYLSVTVSAVHGAVHGAPGSESLILEVVQDITKQKKLIDNLTAREALHSALLRTAVDAIITTDAFGVIFSINPAGERMFGYNAGELVGQNVSILMPMPFRQEHDGYLKRYRETGINHIIGIGREVQAQRRDGRVFPIDLSVSEVKSGTSHFFKGIIRDITERKRLEAQILEISDREQTRIGQDLHDGIGQQLTGIGFLARSLQLRLTETKSPEADVARQLADHVGQAVVQTRALARGLHPVASVPGGLNSALTDLVTTLETTYGVKCRASCDDLLWFKDPTVATHIYRIIQEAANNAIKHGKPQTIDIVLAEHRKTLHVTIEDDGVGFPAQPPEKPGMGLQIMQSRANLIGGKLSVARNQPAGTRIYFALPYESRDEE